MNQLGCSDGELSNLKIGFSSGAGKLEKGGKNHKVLVASA